MPPPPLPPLFCIQALLRSFIVLLASYASSMELAAKSYNAYSKCEYASDCGLTSGFWLLWAVSQLGDF